MKMKEGKRVSSIPSIIFQRRTERLDWRRIASLDIEKLIQDGDADLLEEFITPVLYCKADSEFDLDRTDPGFIKVFRLSQLIGEYFQSIGEKDKEKVVGVENKCAELEEGKVRLVEEIATLKENLNGARRELKRRKELLASTQNEVLGCNNHDEYDQCPYCPKRFLTPVYLHAHIQRRHQGLPLPLHLLAGPGTLSHPNLQQYSSATGFSPKIIPGGTAAGTAAAATVYAFTARNMSPNGNVTTSTAANNTNTNLINPPIMPECFHQNPNLQHQQLQYQNLLSLRRRDSSTQTLITEGEGEAELLLMENLGNSARSEGEMGSCCGRNNENDQNGNNILTSPPPRRESEIASCLPPLQLVGDSGSGGSLGSASGIGTTPTMTRTLEEVLTTVIKSPSRQGAVHERNTNENASEFHVSRVDLNAICELVEKYLEQKSIVGQNQHYDKILSSIHDQQEHHRRLRQDKNRQDDDDYDYDDGNGGGHSKASLYYGFDDDTPHRNKVSKVVSNTNTMMGPTTTPMLSLVGSIGNTNGGGGGPGTRDESNILLLDEAEQNVMRLKDEFEARWGNLSEKVRDSGIEQLKGAFLTEIKKVQEIIQKSPRVSRAAITTSQSSIGTRQNRKGQIDEEGEVKDDDNNENLRINNAKDANVGGTLLGRGEMEMVEERFQKQEGLLTELGKSLQQKMHEDLESLKTKLESQETFWRSKLQAVELEHEKQISKLREDLHLQEMNHHHQEKQLQESEFDRKKDKLNLDEQEVNHAAILKAPPPPPTLLLATPSSLNRTVEKASIGIEINPDEPEGANQTIFVPSITASNQVGKNTQPTSFRRGDETYSERSSYSSEYTSHKHFEQKNEFNPNTSVEVLPPMSVMPIAKPRVKTLKVGESQEEHRSSAFGDTPAANNVQMTDVGIHSRRHDDGVGGGGGGGGKSSGGMIRGINQSMHNIPSHQNQNPHRGIISFDSLEEDQEYLTVIQPEGTHTSITSAVSTNSMNKVVGGGGPHMHEYEEPIHVENLDQVSDYTLSEVRSVEGDGCIESSCSSESEFDDDKGGHAGRNATARKRKKYIFDEKRGKLVEVWGEGETEGGGEGQGVTIKTQMDLVRERTVKEVGEQMEGLGIDPEASTIGMEEMARALKHLKANRRSTDQDPKEFDQERNSLKQEVNYEVAKRSIHQKLDKYGNQAGKKQPGGPLSKMLNKVKKSGTSWKKKVASAMTRKQKSPVKGKQETDEDKTTHFWKSRWGRKMDKKAEVSNPKDKTEDDESTSEDESAVDMEMPPYMTRSKPILERKNGQSKKPTTIPSGEEYSDEDSDDVEIDANKSKGQTPKIPLPSQNKLKGQMIEELKAKQINSKSKNKKSEQIAQMPGALEKPEGVYKGPNFFVNGTPLKTPPKINTSMGNPAGQPHQRQNYPVQVTSNGWSSNTNTNVTRNKPISNNVSKDSIGGSGGGGTNGKKKPFRRDLLEEFQNAEENTIRTTADDQNTRRNNYQNPNYGKHRNPEMEKVVEEIEDKKSSDSSDVECTSFESEDRPIATTTTGVATRGNKNKNPGSVSNTGFTREDETRKGFRGSSTFNNAANKRASSFDQTFSHSDLSDYDEHDGRGEIRKPTQKEKPEKGHYVSLRHPDSIPHKRPNTARTYKKSLSPSPRSKSHNNRIRGQERSKQQHEQQRRSPNSSDSTFHSSDTSVWETDDEEEVGGRNKMGKVRREQNTRETGTSVSGARKEQGRVQQPPNSGYSRTQASTKSSQGGQISRRSPLNNSWDSD